MKPMFCYIVRAKQADGSSVFKIGMAGDVQKRLRSLQSGYPFVLTLEWQTPGGRETELELHDIFDEHRIQGEWFRCSAESEKLLDDLKRDGIRDFDSEFRAWLQKNLKGTDFEISNWVTLYSMMQAIQGRLRRIEKRLGLREDKPRVGLRVIAGMGE